MLALVNSVSSIRGRLAHTKLKKLQSPPSGHIKEEAHQVSDSLQLSQTDAATKGKPSASLAARFLTIGMAATALAGCFGGGASSAATTQQLQEPQVAEMVQPANPFELMRMKDGSIAIDADLANDDAYVLAQGAAIRQDGGVNIAIRTDENSSLCEQAEALGGTCLDSETVVVSDPNGNLIIETFAREGDAVHRIEAKPADGVSSGGIELNKLPAGTEVFSENGSGLLNQNGDLQQYPNF